MHRSLGTSPRAGNGAGRHRAIAGRDDDLDDEFEDDDADELDLDDDLDDDDLDDDGDFFFGDESDDLDDDDLDDDEDDPLADID